MARAEAKAVETSLQNQLERQNITPAIAQVAAATQNAMETATSSETEIMMNRTILHSVVANWSSASRYFQVWRVQGQASDKLRAVVIVDLTGSIEPEARTQAFAALQEAFKHLHRGDELIVIPVTGDAVTEGQGQILRFKVSEQRGRIRFRLEKNWQWRCRKLEKLQSDAAAKPYSKSDILGAVEIGFEELSNSDAKSKRILVVLSDFIQGERPA